METAPRGTTPVEVQIDALLAALEASRAAEESARFTVNTLITVLGPSSHIVVLLVFSVLNMIPGPPGYGETLAVVMVGFALAMLVDAPIRLPVWLGERQLPVGALLRMTGLFARIARFVGRFSRPRLVALSAPAARPFLAVFIIIVSLPMTLPIPLINAVPNVGICVLCLGWINRDAVAVIAGALIAIAGFVLACLAIWGAYHLVIVAIGAAA